MRLFEIFFMLKLIMKEFFDTHLKKCNPFLIRFAIAGLVRRGYNNSFLIRFATAGLVRRGYNNLFLIRFTKVRLVRRGERIDLI